MKAHLNEKAINGLYNSNVYAKAIFHELANMPRQDETVLDAIENKLAKSGKSVPRREIVNFFKSLQDFGAGEMIVGRKGHASRFHWQVDSINLSSIDASFPKTPAPINTAPDPLTAGAPTVLISHRFQLRPDLVISIQLPSDITTNEAFRLGQFINSLPFDTQGPV